MGTSRRNRLEVHQGELEVHRVCLKCTKVHQVEWGNVLNRATWCWDGDNVLDGAKYWDGATGAGMGYFSGGPK